MSAHQSIYVEPRNGYGLTALILGIVGCLAASIPILFAIAGLLGVVGLALALANLGRLRRGTATNRKATYFAMFFSVAAIVLAFVDIAYISSLVS